VTCSWEAGSRDGGFADNENDTDSPSSGTAGGRFRVRQGRTGGRALDILANENAAEYNVSMSEAVFVSSSSVIVDRVICNGDYGFVNRDASRCCRPSGPFRVELHSGQ
jgi:hypothetical protein